MAIESQSHPLLPGTHLHGMFRQKTGLPIELTTSAGVWTGTLNEFTHSYVKITEQKTSKEMYIVLEHIIAFSFPAIA